VYTDYYGLKAAPFQLTPDPKYWFESATHKKAMAYLGYGLAQGEGFIVLTGDVGTGKTTLIGHLMSTIDPARIAAFHIVSSQVGGDDMLRLVAQALSLVTEGVEKAQLLDRVGRHLQDVGSTGRKTLMIVDEAQNLSHGALEELRMLSNFQANGQALLQICLLGQSEFRDRLNSSGSLEQLRQRVIATHHLDPMTVEETLPYLEHRLTLAGWTGNPKFTSDAAAALHRASGGIPRKLNTFAARSMLMGAVEMQSVIDARVAESAIGDMEREAAHQDLPGDAQSTFPLPEGSQALDHAARITMLEAQVQEQEIALRRVLTLLVDWVERDDESRNMLRAPAA
jgi:general secretion pathway protein A